MEDNKVVIEVSQILDNSDKTQPNAIKTMENDILLNLEENIQRQLHEFEVILNQRQPDLPYNGNELNLDEINDVISEQLFNEDLTHYNRNATEKNDSEFITNISINTISSVTDKDDITSISSTDSITSCVYRSSDFEFISEAEAKQDCFIINFKSNNGFYDPGEGTSRMNAASILNEYIDSNTQKYRKRILNYRDRAYRNNHEIPEGDGYLNLFQGIYDPMLQQIYFMENKSIKTSAMNVEYDGMGFDNQFGQPRVDSSDDEFEDEAKENAKRILSMYPRENKRKRRF